MKNQTARFTSASPATLTVFAKKSQTAITVAARMKPGPGEKAQTGCKTTFALDKESDALAAFETLRATAKAKGWTEKVKQTKAAFLELPQAPVAPAKKSKVA